MRTDDDSEEADEPPGNNSGEPEKTPNNAREENEELQWARRHVPQGGSGPRLMFRKTELHDRPPGFRSYRNATSPASDRGNRIAKELARQIAALRERLDDAEDRIDRAIDRLDRRLLALDHEGES